MADPLISETSGYDPVYRDCQLVVTRTESPSGLRFVGEIDINNSDAIAHSLRGLHELEIRPHLDLRNLAFCDVSGIRALVTIARFLGPDRRLLLHGLPDDLQRVIRVTGWAEEPGLSFCQCSEAEQ
jgi:anti-anti-sigma factor